MSRKSIKEHAIKGALAITVFAALSAASMGAHAEDQPVLDVVVVTGTRIKQRTDEGALPVATITHEQIERTGATTAEQFLQSVAVAVQGNSNVVAASGSGATTGGVSSVSLRGLGSQRTLVLINGRRVAGGGTITDSTSVDVNSIPLSALERVEVLKDGASAIYGSDAIAGVINFIIRDNYQGAEFTADGGGTTDGGGSTKKVTALVGFGSLAEDRYNVMFTGSFQKDAALYGNQRGFASSGINVGANNDVTSGNSFPANFVAADGSFGTVNPKAPNCAPSVTDPLNSPGTACRFDPSPLVSLLPEAERYSMFGAVHVALTSDIQLYGEASYSHNKQRFVIQPDPISDQFSLPPNHPLFNVAPYNGFSTILLQPSSPYYPTSFVQAQERAAGTPNDLPALDIRYRSFITGNRDVTDRSEQPRFVAGIKGTIVGWDFDGSFLYSETKLVEHVNSGYPLLTKILPLLNSGTVNFFGPSPANVQAQALATNFVGDAYSTKTSLAGVALQTTKEIAKLPAGSLAVALGAEQRKEKFSVDANPAVQIGDVDGYGGNFLPQNVSRNVTGLSAEVNVPIVKGLTGNAAVRYDNYQNTGSKTVPKFSLGWKPIEQLLVRGSYGKGFRAPSLTELYQPQTTGVTSSGLNDPARCNIPGHTNDARDCATQFGILLGGNPGLSPEKSDNTTLGVVVEPTKNISLGLDGFKIKLENTIIFGVDPQTILTDPQFAGEITRGPPDPSTPGLPGHIIQILQTNLNFGITKVAGVDVDARYRIPTAAAGTFTLSLAGSYFATYQIQNLDGSFTNVAGKRSPITNGNGGVIPRWHHYLTADWNQGPWDVSVAQNFQSSYTDLLGTNEDPTIPGFKERIVGSYTTVDLAVAWSGIPHLRLSVGARNALNKDPPYTNAGGQDFFQSGYDPGYADPRGRFIYGTATYTLK
jgi:iron complex outermembrane recepter protein